MAEGRSEKKVYLEILRVLAVLMVIFNHTDGFYLYYSNTQNVLTWLWSLFFSILCRINVPLFFMISGALLLGKTESLQKLFQKRILRIAAVLTVFSALQYFIDVLRGADVPVSLGWFLKALLSGQIEETYWFLYAYLGVLLLLPFLRILVQEMKPVHFCYLLVLEAVLGAVVPYIGALTGWSMHSGLFFLNQNVFYLLAGFYLDQRKAQKPRKETAAALLTAVSSVFLTGLLVYWRSQVSGTYDVNNLNILTPILAMAVFAAVRNHCERTEYIAWFKRAVLCVGANVFGIYLIEQPVRILLLPVYLYLCEHTVGAAACTVYVLGTFGIAFLLTAVGKRIPLLGELL